jgi:DNA-binding LacI/PurR family transcriptional regulator
MPFLRPLSASEQAAAHLRKELERGHWSGMMPGVSQLTNELGINHKTIEAALRQLEHEGLLVGQGQGRRRLIVQSDTKAARPMRIAMLDYEPVVFAEGYMIELQHLLLAAGHTAFFTDKSLMELDMDLARVRRLVNRTEADAWVIAAGSREVLEWFCAQRVPAFALFGRREGLPIAATGPDKVPAMAAATRHLIGLGHRRIVLVARRLRRLPKPGRGESAFVDELKAHDVHVSDFNLPDWEETIDGFQELMNSLFQVTPPTALIIDEASFFIATQQFLAGGGIRVPQQVSLICTDADPAFAWCRPAISHIRWDSGPVVRRIVRWAATVSRGGRDVRQTSVPAEFIVGGTTGVVLAERMKEEVG